jgi:hypothetical protein
MGETAETAQLDLIKEGLPDPVKGQLSTANTVGCSLERLQDAID